MPWRSSFPINGWLVLARLGYEHVVNIFPQLAPFLQAQYNSGALSRFIHKKLYTLPDQLTCHFDTPFRQGTLTTRTLYT